MLSRIAQNAFYVGSPVSGPYVCVWPMRWWNMFPPDAHYLLMSAPFIPHCSSPHPPHSSSMVWPSPLGWTLVTVKWVRWYWAWGLSALIFLSHSILIKTDVGLDCILGEHRSHISLPQKTHVTSDLLRGYTVSCFIQSQMWDIPNWYLQLPTIKCSTIWSVQDDIKQNNNASICFAGVQVSIKKAIYCGFVPILLLVVMNIYSSWYLL